MLAGLPSRKSNMRGVGAEAVKLRTKKVMVVTSSYYWGYIELVHLALLDVASQQFCAIGQTNIKRLMAHKRHRQCRASRCSASQPAPCRPERHAGLSRDLPGDDAGHLRLHPARAALRGRYIETIADLAGLSRGRPTTALILAILMFCWPASALAGFIGKLYVFKAAVDAGLIWFAVVGVVLSVVGAYYYLRIVKLTYFDEPAEAFDPAPYGAVSAVAGLSALLLLFFIVPPPLAVAQLRLAAATSPAHAHPCRPPTAFACLRAGCHRQHQLCSRATSLTRGESRASLSRPRSRPPAASPWRAARQPTRYAAVAADAPHGRGCDFFLSPPGVPQAVASCRGGAVQPRLKWPNDVQIVSLGHPA